MDSQLGFSTTHRWVFVWPSPGPLPTIFTIELLAKMLRASFPWYTVFGHTTNVVGVI
jgi:hypothetical protein